MALKCGIHGRLDLWPGPVLTLFIPKGRSAYIKEDTTTLRYLEPGKAAAWALRPGRNHCASTVLRAWEYLFHCPIVFSFGNITDIAICFYPWSSFSIFWLENEEICSNQTTTDWSCNCVAAYCCCTRFACGGWSLREVIYQNHITACSVHLSFFQACVGFESTILLPEIWWITILNLSFISWCWKMFEGFTAARMMRRSTVFESLSERCGHLKVQDIWTKVAIWRQVFQRIGAIKICKVWPTSFDVHVLEKWHEPNKQLGIGCQQACSR